MSDIEFIVAAYAVTWVVLLAYALHLTGRRRALARAAAERTALGSDA